MLDPTDYKEPACALCGGNEFYNPNPDAPIGKVPLDRIIDKLDAMLNRNDMPGAEKHLEYWLSEATALKDRRGELTILSEMMGLYRKTRQKEKGLDAVDRGVKLAEKLGVADSVSGATILLNAATTKKAFGEAEAAMPLYSRAKAVYDRDLEKTDSRRAGLFNNRALAFADLGRYEEAESDYLAALEVLGRSDDDDNDIAITYVNLAHLYEVFKGREFALESMENAKKYLESPKIVRDGYHAYVCSKCAPSFEHFGLNNYAKMLVERSEELYARN